MVKHFVKAFGIFTLHWIILTFLGFIVYLIVEFSNIKFSNINDNVFILFPIVEFLLLILTLWLRYKRINARNPIRKTATDSIAFVVSFAGATPTSVIETPYLSLLALLLVYMIIMVTILRIKDGT